MVILGGLELVAAGYLIDRHQKNKKEARRLREEQELLEENRYRIYSPDNAGPGRRRSHSHDRHDRKHSHSRRHHSHDRRSSRDDRREDRKHRHDNFERPQRESRPHASSAPPPMYPAPPASILHQGPRPAPPAMTPGGPPAEQFPVTGWPQHWDQSQRVPGNPQQTQPAQQMPPNLAPYYRDPAQADVKYGFQDGEDERDRGRATLSPEGSNRGHGRSRSSRSVRFDLQNGRQPGDEPPPPYNP